MYFSATGMWGVMTTWQPQKRQRCSQNGRCAYRLRGASPSALDAASFRRYAASPTSSVNSTAVG